MVVTDGLRRGKIVEMPIRIYVLDDHELVRTGLQTLLECEEDMDVVGQGSTAQQGLEEIATLQPDVAILDVRLPDGSGIEVCREIRSLYPDIACLMLTSYADDEALFSAIMAGAAGYVLKEIGGSDLIGDIRRVSQGASLIDATLSKDIFDRLRKSQKTEARLSSLSPQERRVLDLIAQGRSNRQIAEEIFLAEKTVKNYVSSLLSKLGMQRRTEAGVYAAILAERRAVSPKTPPPVPSCPRITWPRPGDEPPSDRIGLHQIGSISIPRRRSSSSSRARSAIGFTKRAGSCSILRAAHKESKIRSWSSSRARSSATTCW